MCYGASLSNGKNEEKNLFAPYYQQLGAVLPVLADLHPGESTKPWHGLIFLSMMPDAKS